MPEEYAELDEAKEYLEFTEVLKAIQESTPHVTVHIGVGETTCVVGARQLALRNPAFTGPSRKVVERTCQMLIDALAAKDERIRRILEMGYDRRYDR